ncbi:E3 UFM1-protein ligase 1-like protein [Drosera capensis]
MDEELLELQRQFESAQQAKSSIRLSERNVVELVQKLRELHIINYDLLHTVTGKEYITPEQLRLEIAAEIKKLGRVSLIDLADIVGVDLYHVEKQAQLVASDDSGLMLIQGEVISNSYWDNVAEDVNERLQESSQIGLAEIAAQIQVGSELVASMLESRIGTLVKGRLEGGQLYTPAYVARVTAMVRGATRAVTVPMNLTSVWNSLQQLLQQMDGATCVAVDNSFVQSLFNGLVKEGAILGSLRAGVHWTPTVFATAQKDCVDSLFSQNSFISYDALHKLGIPQPVQYLQSRYPEGIPLVTIFIHSSMIEMLDASVEDAIESNSWIDSLSVLPLSFGPQDAFKSNRGIILGESCLVSEGFIKDIFTHVEKEMHTFQAPMKESKVLKDTSQLSEFNESGMEGGSNKTGLEKVPKKKKGRSSRSSASAVVVDVDNQDSVPEKNKKNQRKGKDASSLHISGSKATKEDANVPSEEWVIDKICTLVPEFEEQGIADPEVIVMPLAKHLRPMLLNVWSERRKTLFAENADRMKQLLDSLQKKFEESFLSIQLYEKALDLFESDQSTSNVLHRHLLRTTSASIVDVLLLDLAIHNKLKNGIEVEDAENPESHSLSRGDRINLAKGLQGSLAVKAVAMVESLEGKSVGTFMTALAAVAEESDLLIKRLDKKLERTLLHSYRKDLTLQVSSEADPVSLLPKVVSLLYLKGKLDDAAYKILMDYHSATVMLLSLMAAATGGRLLGRPDYDTEGDSRGFNALLEKSGSGNFTISGPKLMLIVVRENLREWLPSKQKEILVMRILGSTNITSIHGFRSRGIRNVASIAFK